MTDRLGVVTDGAFNATLTVRLDPGVSTEKLRIGDFVIIEGSDHVFFSTIADIQLRTTDAGIASQPPAGTSSFIARALAGTATYATVQVKPMLMIDKPQGAFVDITVHPQPVRTIPMHFAILRQAGELDFRDVFGEDHGHLFAMGYPLTMDIPVCLDLRRLMERSNGVFGQSGTGKSFLVRLLLCGIIDRQVGVNLVFDMHDEYAFGKQSEEGVWVRGLKELFGSRVLVYSLDERAARRQGHRADVILKIGLNQIEPEDILLLAEALNLRGTAEATIGLLQDHYGDRWFPALLDMSSEELNAFCEESGAHPASLASLQRQLKLIGRRPYIVPEAQFAYIDDMVAALDHKRHVILHFGANRTTLDHILVANIVTRRVRHLYQQKVERYEETRNAADRPQPLMITLEEAHLFLNPSVARQTIFGTIARELRKYYVTLMVVDQRPSGIDPEVLSQLGTRITGKMTEERDIEAVLTGVANRSVLRSALESLDTRQQILMMGHAVPMPIVLRTRRYDDAFYRSLRSVAEPGPEPVDELERMALARARVQQDISDLFGD
ncbi:MAG: ATP-binding protein [Anaerolineae bacterium]|nr:ATP-binding protein [Anaerolineae bacterium]MDW8097923.1 ATP-binding protein [Anaerolineae bacterium]